MNMRWYILHVITGRENSVKRDVKIRTDVLDMQDRIGDVIVPTHEEVDVRGGERKLTPRNMYPGYVLVHAVMDDDVWSMLRRTPGVTGFISTVAEGEERRRPIPLEDSEVERIMGLMAKDKPLVNVGVRTGDTVRIVSGPFRDFMGLVDEVHEDRGKVRVQVTFLGKETPVELDFMQVESA